MRLTQKLVCWLTLLCYFSVASVAATHTYSDMSPNSGSTVVVNEVVQSSVDCLPGLTTNNSDTSCKSSCDAVSHALENVATETGRPVISRFHSATPTASIAQHHRAVEPQPPKISS